MPKVQCSKKIEAILFLKVSEVHLDHNPNFVVDLLH